MGWSEHSAGLWRLSIFSRFMDLHGCFPETWIGCILARLSHRGGETLHVGDPAYTTAEEGSRSLVNEGFATLTGVRAQGAWP